MAKPFSGCAFQQTADFTNARFYYPPDLQIDSNAARIKSDRAPILVLVAPAVPIGLSKAVLQSNYPPFEDCGKHKKP